MPEERRFSIHYLAAILFGELLAVVLLRIGVDVYPSVGIASSIVVVILFGRHLRGLGVRLASLTSSAIRSIKFPSFQPFRFGLRRLLAAFVILGVLLASIGYVASFRRHRELYHTPVAESVTLLNGVAANDAMGKNQRPLTEREVIAALEEWLEQPDPWVPEADGKKLTLRHKAKTYVKRVVDSHKLPRDFQIVWTGSVNSRDWSAQLNVVIPDHIPFGVPVRSVAKTEPPQ